MINELIDGNKLPNLCTVINGLDLKKRKYGYYYGYGKYGKYYGYGKRYGYGYGYGEHKVKRQDLLKIRSKICQCLKTKFC